MVCDGFLGNVVLKMLEGVTEVVTDPAKDAYREISLASPTMPAGSSSLRTRQISQARHRCSDSTG